MIGKKQDKIRTPVLTEKGLRGKFDGNIPNTYNKPKTSQRR